jgi:flagellar hook-associated protein 2
MATISSPGVGSGLDISGLVQKLMSAEQGPLNAITSKQSAYQGKLSAYGTIKSGLSTFQTTLQKLTDAAKLQPRSATAGDTSVLDVTADTSAVAGDYSIAVSKLAQAQKLVAAGQSDTTTAIGTGTLTFDFGTITGGTLSNGQYSGATFTGNGQASKTVTIDSAHATLAGIRDAINAAGIGVKASIVNDGSGTPYRLTLSSTQTGAASSMKISVNGDIALANLLDHDPSAAAGQALSQTQSAQNAEFTVDGLPISKASNSISDVIPGLTLALKKTGSTSLSVATDTATVKNNIQAFVDGYNKLVGSLKNLSNYDATTKKASVLTGDSAVRSILAQMSNIVTGTLDSSVGSLTRLSDIGISLQKDGSLLLDSSKLQTALNQHSDQLPALFAASGNTTGSQGFAVQLDKLATATLADNGPLDSRTAGINSTLKRLDDDKLREQDRLSRLQTQYLAQYTKLDTIMSQMNSTSTYLTQQLAALAKSS